MLSSWNSVGATDEGTGKKLAQKFVQCFEFLDVSQGNSSKNSWFITFLGKYQLKAPAKFTYYSLENCGLI